MTIFVPDSEGSDGVTNPQTLVDTLKAIVAAIGSGGGGGGGGNTLTDDGTGLFVIS